MTLRTAAGTLIFALCTSVIMATPKASRSVAQTSPSVGSKSEFIFVEAPVVAAGALTERFPQGSRLVRLTSGTKPSQVVNLTPDFFAAADPQVSFEGSKVLFAAQKDARSRWQVWEMKTDGSDKRQITNCADDCLRPAFLPRGEIVYTEITKRGDGSSRVVVSNEDGSDPRVITFGPGNFQVETVLRNGLILVSAAAPLVPSTSTDGSRELYTVRVDGTGLTSFRCDHQQRAVRTEAQELADGSVVFVKNTSAQGQVGGELAEIRRGALHNSVITPLQAVSWSPRRLEGQRLIVARKVVTAQNHEPKFDLYAFDSVSGTFSGPLYRDKDFSSVQAVPIAAHPVPRAYWSTLNPNLNVGYFICLDAYQAADAPQGRITASIAQVRVLALDSETNREKNLGEAPVEKDGSFFVAVPPDKPVRFELLDSKGQVLRAQRSWVWTRPGEERGCAGCHEDKTLAPENRWPETLRRFDTPTRLGVSAPAQAAH
ncbi:MAG TPA: hypothetical protein VFD30_04340 [Terriglobia bacterium]|nr:hypothetical protein [Terriglobia bacterium]